MRNFFCGFPKLHLWPRCWYVMNHELLRQQFNIALRSRSLHYIFWVIHKLFICFFTRFLKVYSWYFQNSVNKIFNCPFTSLPTVRSQDFKRSFHDIIIPFTRFSTICLQDSKLYLEDFHMPGYRFFSLSIHKTSKVSFTEFSTVWSQYFEMAVKDF